MDNSHKHIEDILCTDCAVQTQVLHCEACENYHLTKKREENEIKS